MSKARYIMIGGFLGAGKTTALLSMARRLTESGRNVGLITNDQSTGLVDTALLNASGFPTEEITGGCFCCKFSSLVEAAEKLSVKTRPDVFLAEPVGSCTDLKATVSYPLRRMYGDDFSIAPLSVMVDPVRALRVLGVETGKVFSPKVVYIYEKQLEEAEFLVINKCDQVDEVRLSTLESALRRRYPRADVLRVSARQGDGVEQWLEELTTNTLGDWPSMEIDYADYAEGEALLGWLNCTVRVESETEADGNQLLSELANGLRMALQAESAEVAHLKMTLAPSEGGRDLAVINLVHNESEPELSHCLEAPLKRGELILNLRAEGPPDMLRSVVSQVLRGVQASIRLTLVVEHIEAFQPSPPTPTHRFTEA